MTLEGKTWKDKLCIMLFTISDNGPLLQLFVKIAVERLTFFCFSVLTLLHHLFICFLYCYLCTFSIVIKIFLQLRKIYINYFIFFKLVYQGCLYPNLGGFKAIGNMCLCLKLNFCIFQFFLLLLLLAASYIHFLIYLVVKDILAFSRYFYMHNNLLSFPFLDDLSSE